MSARWGDWKDEEVSPEDKIWIKYPDGWWHVNGRVRIQLFSLDLLTDKVEYCVFIRMRGENQHVWRQQSHPMLLEDCKAFALTLINLLPEQT